MSSGGPVGPGGLEVVAPHLLYHRQTLPAPFYSKKMFDLYSSYLLTQSEPGSVTVAAAAASSPPSPPTCTQQVLGSCARACARSTAGLEEQGCYHCVFVFSGEVCNHFVLLFTVAFTDLDQHQQGLSASAWAGRLNQSAIQLSAVIDWNTS